VRAAAGKIHLCTVHQRNENYGKLIAKGINSIYSVPEKHFFYCAVFFLYDRNFPLVAQRNQYKLLWWLQKAQNWSSSPTSQIAAPTSKNKLAERFDLAVAAWCLLLYRERERLFDLNFICARWLKELSDRACWRRSYKRGFSALKQICGGGLN